MTGCPPITREEVEKGLRTDFDQWFAKLQALTTEKLDPEEWTVNWFDGWTPEASLEHGPADQDD